MKTRLCFGLLLSTVIATHVAAQNAHEEELGGLGSGSPGITQGELDLLRKSGFAARLQRPRALAFSDDQLKFWADKAKAAFRSAPVAKGDLSTSYDVII